ncbi:MAG: amidohydrolase [Saprospiraceae bacterium]|nr:amidohydrolase [Saprospiraceae bacterium]
MESTTQTMYFNAKIFTVNPQQTWADAMLIDNGLILAIGSKDDVVTIADKNVNEVDLDGKFVMPGIHDVHMHPLEASSSNFDFIISDEVEDPELYYNDVLAASNSKPGNGWLLGWGHYIHTVVEAERNPKEILDEVSLTRPIAIMEQTSHSLWVNSKALEIASISIDSENPVGGVIMRDENDEPDGILVDNAGNVLLDIVLQPSQESEQNDYDGMVTFGFPELAKHGITSFSDARTYWKRNHHLTWQKLANDGQLTARANLGIWVYPADEDETQIDQIKALYENNSNDLLRSNQIKVYIDGIVPNTTAAMHSEYKFDMFGEATNNGVNYLTQERLEKYITALEPLGYDFHIHAIGNRGIHEALNAIENSSSGTGRHRITHCEIVDTEDLPRFASLNVTADCQVAGDFTNPDQWHENDDFIDAHLSNNLVPIKSLLENGARITLSSDWDVSNLNPFVGIQNAVTRAPQNITLEEAIEAYTIHAAYTMRQEDKVGSLEVGKEADFIVLNQNIMEIPVSSISTTKVISTYLQGEKVF